MRVLVGFAIACLLGSCGGPGRPRHRMDLRTRIAGLSGLTVDDQGHLWSIAESERVMVRIEPDNGRVTVFPITGMPDHIEAESITWLSPGRFAVGTEGTGPPRPMDDIVYLLQDGDEMRVEGMVACPYSQWELVAEDNTGIEGICAVNGDILVATEVVGNLGGRRYAPLARRDTAGTWTAFRVWLSSADGKISGLTCRPGEDGSAEVLAIERHFGVTRLLEFTVPAEALAETIEPDVVAEFDRWMQEQPLSPNFEGIARLRDGRIALVVDNFYRGRSTGPTELWWVDLD